MILRIKRKKLIHILKYSYLMRKERLVPCWMKILALMNPNKVIYLREVARKVYPSSLSTVHKYVNLLIELGFVEEVNEEIESSTKIRYRFLRLTEKGKKARELIRQLLNLIE